MMRKLYTSVWLIFVLNLFMKTVDIITTAVIIDIVGSTNGEANPIVKYMMDELSVSGGLTVSFMIHLICLLVLIIAVKLDKYVSEKSKRWAWAAIYISTIAITVVAINNIIVLIRYA